MTQEDKKLLLKDLCGRLPYGVKVHTNIPEMDWSSEELIECESDKILSIEDIEWLVNDCGEFKPYLRPLSSMTEEELEQYHMLQSDIWKPCGTMYYDNIRSIDWLNAHHFDYRNLIEKDLAIAVTEENNPYKE